MTAAPECFQPESGHTQTPWRIFTNPDGTKLVGIGAENGEGILDSGFGVWAWNDPEGIANAELVVKAVNNHERLVEALKLARARIEYLGAASPNPKHFEANASTFLPAIDEVLGDVGSVGERGK